MKQTALLEVLQKIQAEEAFRISNWLRAAGYGKLPVRNDARDLATYIQEGAYHQQAQHAISSLFNMVLIPAGSFMMGSPLSEEERFPHEGPQHNVTLESFLLSETPITQAQWREVAGWVEGPGERWGRQLDPDPSYLKGNQRPVEHVSWHEAMEFCSRLSQRTGQTYTLPSEAQWEYACRAGTTTPFHCGETLTLKEANFSATETTDVKTYPPNPWGLYDMHGNVWEWCSDDWHNSYDGAPNDGRPWLEDKCLGKSSAAALGSTIPGSAARPTASGPTRSTTTASGVSASVASPESAKVLRGGPWNSILPVFCRSASRCSTYPAIAYDIVGFRVCCLP